MTTLLLTLCLTLATVIAEVHTVDGEAHRGELAAWSDESVALDIDNERREWATDRVQSIRLPDVDTSMTRPKIWVRLHDQSRIAATEIQTDGDRANIKTLWETITCPLRGIHTVRWYLDESERDDLWQEVIDHEFEGDAIIVRRDADNLDFLEGTVQSISSESVSFEFDQQGLDLALDRLAGLVLFHAPTNANSRARYQCHARDQSEYHAANMTLMDNGTVNILTVGGVRLSVPLTELTDVNLATQSLVYVSDLQPEQSDVEPWLPSSHMNDQVVELLYRPRMNEGFDKKPLKLRYEEESEPRNFDKGIALHSRTRLVYRLDEPYRRLKGVIGWDPEFGRNGGSVQVTIRAGQEILLDDRWNPGDPPRDFELPIEDAKRLEFIVDYGDGSDNGDRINLCNVRLLK